MRPLLLACVALGIGCAAATGAPDPVGVDPREAPPASPSTPGAPAAPAPPLPEPSCAGDPPVGPAGAWRHPWKSPLISALGAPRHRGLDLVVGASAATQPIRGEIKYGGLVDKSLEDEAVDLWACRAGAWVALGSAVTDDEGGFELDLAGAARLPIGLRALYVSVVGDRTGAAFVALVAPDGSALAVSDVDGTLTTSENAFPDALVSGAPVAAWPDAAHALSTLAARGYTPVYLTARGRVFSADTRAWLAANGFPVGPLRLAPSMVTLPGDATVDYKAGAMAELAAGGLVVAVGIGNRASDGAAYARAHVAADRTFLKLPEFADEVQPLVDAHQAVGFTDYAALDATVMTLPPAP